MHPHIKKRLIDNIQWYACTAVDGALDKTFSAMTIKKGYCVSKKRMVRTREGKEIISNTTVYLNGTETVGKDDECIVPYGVRTPVLQITPYKSINGGLLEILI